MIELKVVVYVANKKGLRTERWGTTVNGSIIIMYKHGFHNLSPIMATYDRKQRVALIYITFRFFDSGYLSNRRLPVLLS